MNLLINLLFVFLIFWFFVSLFLIGKSYFINRENLLLQRRFFCSFMLGTPLIFLFLLIFMVVSDPIAHGVKATTIEARFEIIEKDAKHLVMKSPLTGSEIIYDLNHRGDSYISNFQNRKIGETIYIYSFRPTVLPMNCITWLDYKIRRLPTNRTFSDQLEVVQRYRQTHHY